MKILYNIIYQIILTAAFIAHFQAYTQYQYEFLQEKKPVILFQPSDGSLENGTYSPITNQALTSNFSYNQITIVPKTQTGPILNANGMFQSDQGDLLFPVGIFAYFSEKTGDTTFYCIFGKKINTSSSQNTKE